MKFSDYRLFSLDMHLLTLEPDLFQTYKPASAKLQSGVCDIINGVIETTFPSGAPISLIHFGQIANVQSANPTISGSFVVWSADADTDQITLSFHSPGLFEDPPVLAPFPSCQTPTWEIYTFDPLARLIADNLMRSLGLDPTNPDHAALITPGQNCTEWSTLAVMAAIYRARASAAIATADYQNLTAQRDLYERLAARAFNRMRLKVQDPETGREREIVPGHIQLTRA